MSVQEASPLLDRIRAAIQVIGNAEKNRQLREVRLKQLIAQFQTEEEASIRTDDELLAAAWEQLDRIVNSPDWEGLVAAYGHLIKLDIGTITLRQGPPSLVVEDESALMKSIRRLGKVLPWTRQPKRVVDKNAIKAAIAANPSLLARIRGVRLETPRRIVVKPTNLQAELVRPLSRNSRPVTV